MFANLKRVLILLFVGVCILQQPLGVEAAIQAWSNYRLPIGGEGTEVYLEKAVQVTYTVGATSKIHYIKGEAKLVKNWVDPYCYVKADGEWFVHLYGWRTDNGHSTTGWYKESDVIESAGLGDVDGYIVYGSRGDATNDKVIQGSVLNASYGINSSKWITKGSTGNKFHQVRSGGKLGSSGLYDATTFQLSQLGYVVTGWVNVDSTGKKYKTYDFTTQYNVDDFVVSSGKKLKDASNGAVIYLQPVWKYTNTGPSITAKDIHILEESVITADRLLKDVVATDKEDGDISNKVNVKNMEEFEKWLKEQKEDIVSKDEVREFELQLEVADSHGVGSTGKVKVKLYKFPETKAEGGYVRYISKEYKDTFSSNSVWSSGIYKNYILAIW